MSINKILLIAVCCLCIFGCSTTTKLSVNQTLQLDINIVDPDRIRFSGKGAGAGMMLSGSMGAMGVAVGVAIDEGIGKQIDETARAGGVNIKNIVAAAFIAANQEFGTGNAAKMELAIQRYGFVTAAGEGDPVLPQLQISLLKEGIPSLSVKYPDQFEVQSVFQLDQIKINAELIEAALAQAAESMANRIFGSRSELVYPSYY